VPLRERKENTFMYLARMYVLGEKIIDQAFQNAVVNAMIALHVSAKGSQNFPSYSTIDIVYKGTSDNSPVRRLLVDLWAFNMLPTWHNLEILKEAGYKPFTDDLLQALVEKRGVPDTSQARPWVLQPDSYHSKIVVLKMDMSAQKNENTAVEAASQDDMDVSEA
jgi:hypothetical protein